MATIHTLSQLLIQSDCQYQVYDLGRRIRHIDNKTFSDVEHGLQPYPYPLQRKAHLAICYWNESKQPWIWFLKFELDERGLLKQADVGNFLKYVIEAIIALLCFTPAFSINSLLSIFKYACLILAKFLHFLPRVCDSHLHQMRCPNSNSSTQLTNVNTWHLTILYHLFKSFELMWCFTAASDSFTIDSCYLYLGQF